MLRKGLIWFSGKGKDQGEPDGGQPSLCHVRAFRQYLVKENGRRLQPQGPLYVLGQGALVSVTRSPRSIGNRSVPGSRSTLAVKSVLRECGLAEQIAL